MNPTIAILSVILSYLIGSISFARLITKWWAPWKDVTQFEISVEGIEDRYKGLSRGGIGIRSVRF
jgi:glycerol-3-phosphate acyltransferase PlsY